nr:7-cyano-7-deazaguanine synthase QueC [Bacteriovoracaceae bacterium]
MKKKALVIHSGGMDSSLCLKLALQKYGASAVLSISFSYGQKHSVELECAKKICSDWNIQHEVLDLSVLQKITENALTHHEIPIVHKENSAPNTLVVGRNGLMARLAAIYAHTLGAHEIYMGVMELEVANSGYPDCSREYMDLKEKILQKDLNDPKFRIVTPLIHMTKKE